MQDYYVPSAVVVLDQGSRAGGALLPGTPTLIIDHHQSLAFLEDAMVLSSCGHDPVATSSMLAYLCCHPLHADVARTTAWLAVAGTLGDLGTSFTFQPPYPDMAAVIKSAGGRKAFSMAVSLINAPHRTAACDSMPAWFALSAAAGPMDINPASPTAVPQAVALLACRWEVTAAVNAAARTSPKFSGDGRVAWIAISSPAQIHPLIATRWARSLKGKNLQVVICSNDAYLPGRVNFAARVAQQGGATAAAGGSLNLIAFFTEAAAQQEGLLEQLGSNFARGHAQATGGSVSQQAFQRLSAALGLGGLGGESEGTGKRGIQGGAAPDVGQKRSKTLLQFGFTKTGKEL